jgi:hypothetical protein
MRSGCIHLPILVGTALLVLTPHPALAERATEGEMRTVCQNFLAYMVHQQGNWAGEAAPWIADVQEINVDDIVLARNYSIGPHGHVVVPVLKDLPPIKTYSENCDIDVDQTHGFPALLREILADRARRFVDAYGSLDATQPATGRTLLGHGHRVLWDRFLVDPTQFQAALAEGMFAPREQVGPLLTTIWHQLEPYYDLCPMGDGGRCVVGCVATATTQVMRYWSWPPVGRGSHCYMWSGDQSCGGNSPGGELCADFSDLYDWENMPDNCYGGCSPEEQAALAELNYEVGVAEFMDYGHCGSGTMMDLVASALSEYFRYDPEIGEEFRDQYTPESWFTLIQSEINAGRPMVYGIPGHAIVCDGWRDTDQNEYHMNYGWGGGYNAWYAIDELYGTQNPLYEQLVRGIMPHEHTLFTIRADGTGDLASIQDAIDIAWDGNIVELEDGVYAGDGNRDIDLLGKTITIRSASGDFTTCIIDCQGSEAEPHRGFYLHSGEMPQALIEGITIRGGYAGSEDADGGAILCANGASPTIQNCMLAQNTAFARGGAVSCWDTSAPELRNCVFLDNEALGDGGGLSCNDAIPVIENCAFVGNAAHQGSAIAAIGSSAPDIHNSIIAFGPAGEPVFCGAGGAVTLACCDVYGNADGDWVGCIAGQFGIDGNISADPLFCDAAGNDFTLSTESPCVPHTPPNEECDLIGAFGVGCGAIIVYEDGSGPFPTIQAAIDAVIEGSTIHLADGVFTGDGNRDIDCGGKPVTVCSQSGNPETCVIDCQGTPEDWHRAFYFASGEGPQSIIEDVTVRNGYYDIAGAVLVDASSPTFRNVIFADNYADFAGAVRCRDGCLSLFDRVMFIRNSSRIGGGAYCMGYSNATFRNCTFHANSATHYGAGLRLHDHTNAIIENTIIAFSTDGSAVSCNNASYPILSCCDLYGNAGGDWVEQIAEQYGVNGNISEDPLFCDPENGNLNLDEDSPCGPFTPPNEECDLIGARPVGCDPSTVEDHPLPDTSVRLGASVPNPFGLTTRIGYTIPETAAGTHVRFGIYDLSGRRIRLLVDEPQSGGVYNLLWNGTDQSGITLPAGIYFYRLSLGEEVVSRQVLLVR